MSEPLPGVSRNKHLAVHGHFYQPPRENPWTGGIDPEPSASPYPDWNARIAQECYGPNGAGPVLSPEGKIVDMSDNYARLSFNFGPTLLVWLEREHPEIYAKVRAHPENALAQPYFHVILPLQSGHGRRLNIEWGLADFKRRFGRPSAGLWLPETAADSATLEDLVDAGVEFTILHPRQARRVRPVGGGDGDWREVTQDTLIPTRPYRWLSKRSPGKSLTLFFFHRLLHEDVISGEAFKAPDTLFRKVFGRIHPDDSTQLIFIATDGEFFGHHNRKGAAGLAQTFFLAGEAGFGVTTPERFRESFPAPQEVEIVEGGSWSCEHGLERWRSDCGCRSPHLKSWSQAWRGPLREALDWLARELDLLYERKAGGFFKDFRVARFRFGEVIAAGEDAIDAFLDRECLPALAKEERPGALLLLELLKQRHAMFTSCAWFFDDVSGIETVQVLKHAGRAVEIAEIFGASLSADFKKRLSSCLSNLSDVGTAASVYEKALLSSRVHHERLAAHWAILSHLRTSLAGVPPDWSVTAGMPARANKQGLAGRDRSLSAVRLELTRRSTREKRAFTAIVHQKDRLDITCRLAPAGTDASALFSVFENRDDAAFELALNQDFGARFQTLEALLPADRAEALRYLTPDPVGGAAKRELLDLWVAAMGRLRGGAPEDDCLELLPRAKKLKIPVERLPWVGETRRAFRRALESLLDGADEKALARAGRWLAAFEDAGLHVDLWALQELFWRWRARLLERGAAASAGERRLAAAFGEKLGFAQAALPLETTGTP